MNVYEVYKIPSIWMVYLNSWYFSKDSSMSQPIYKNTLGTGFTYEGYLDP